jgi:hypothetical protein
MKRRTCDPPTWPRALGVVMLLIGFIPASCQQRWDHMGDRLQFPAETNGWRASGPVATYGRHTVFDYMDGAGELYLAYDFRRVRVQEYRRPAAAEITVEAYEMSSSEDAYGVFTHDPEGEDVGVGQDNAYAAGLLRFWKGRCFFRILADEDRPEAKATVLSLGRSLADQVAAGVRPALARRLPDEHLERASVRYFHTQVSLNSFYYLADENLLRLSPRTEAVLAVYRPDSEKLTLLVIRYPTRRDAVEARRSFARAYLEEEPASDEQLLIRPVEDHRHVGMSLTGACLALVFDARTPTSCAHLLRAAGSHL